MLDPVPWAVTGAKSSADIARVLGNFATDDGNGIRMPWDLKVEQLPVAGNQVRVQPGVAALRNIYAQAGYGQSYVVRNISATDVPVPPTDTTGGATRYLLLRVSDPQYGGQVPADVLNGPYVFFEWASTKTGHTFPHVVLGRIVQPANTSTITTSMIFSERTIYRPLQETDQLLVFPSGDIGVTMSKAGYAGWPYTGVISNIPVPLWATSIDITAHISGAEIAGGDNFGGLRTVFDGAAASQNSILRGNTGRHTVSMMGRHPVSAAQRGTLRSVALQGYQTGGTGSITADYQTNILTIWRFTGLPV